MLFYFFKWQTSESTYIWVYKIFIKTHDEIVLVPGYAIDNKKHSIEARCQVHEFMLNVNQFTCQSFHKCIILYHIETDAKKSEQTQNYTFTKKSTAFRQFLWNLAELNNSWVGDITLVILPWLDKKCDFLTYGQLLGQFRFIFASVSNILNHELTSA